MSISAGASTASSSPILARAARNSCTDTSRRRIVSNRSSCTGGEVSSGEIGIGGGGRELSPGAIDGDARNDCTSRTSGVISVRSSAAMPPARRERTAKRSALGSICAGGKLDAETAASSSPCANTAASSRA
jgi:hypothetical protein